MALPEREDSPPGEASRTGNVLWTVPATGGGADPEPIEQWLAVCRVERLLEGLGMARGRRRELVIQNCMTRAIGRWQEQPGADLSALALDQIEDALERWFAHVLDPERLAGRPPLLVGQAALAACDVARRWPNVLLTYDHLPPAFVEAMRTVEVMPTPAELPGSMLEQTLQSWSLRELLVRALGRWGLPGPAAPAA